MFSLICVWINGWVNNREAGDLRRYLAHYDVTVMGSANKTQGPNMPRLQPHLVELTTLIASFMGPPWGPSGADRTQVGPMLAPWTLLSTKRSIWPVMACWDRNQDIDITPTWTKYICRGSHRQHPPPGNRPHIKPEVVVIGMSLTCGLGQTMMTSPNGTIFRVTGHLSAYTMQSTVSSQPPRQICTHFRLFCSPPLPESRVSGYRWWSELKERVMDGLRESSLVVTVMWKGTFMFIRAGSTITGLTSVYSDTDQRKHQSSPSLAFVRRIHRWLVNSPHKWPVTREMFPFDDVIMNPTFSCDKFMPSIINTKKRLSNISKMISQRYHSLLIP